MITFKLNTAALSNQIADIIRVTGREASEVIEQEGKLLAKDLVKFTPPFSNFGATTESFAKQKRAGEAAVVRDVGLAFHLLDLEKIRSPRLRERLRVLAKKGDLSGVEEALRSAKIPVRAVYKEATEDLHKKLRDKRGRIRKDQHIWVLSGRSLSRLVRTLKSHVGRAKAGWNAAAQSLGLKVPAWISRHGASGGSFRRVKGHNAKITLINLVDHAQFAGAEFDIVNRALKNRSRNIKAKLAKIAKAGWKKNRNVKPS